MSQQHPITPPPELVREWHQSAAGIHFHPYGYSEYIATQAARWGADMELRACCDTLQRHAHWDLAVFELMDDRRPKPPSLKVQALAKLPEHPESMASYLSLSPGSVATIRRALEALDD